MLKRLVARYVNAISFWAVVVLVAVFLALAARLVFPTPEEVEPRQRHAPAARP
jgi:hypothetical protein